MIRLYRPRSDTGAIIRLIRSELVPLARIAPPRKAVSDKALRARLRRGVSFVASRGYAAPPDGFVHVLIPQEGMLVIDMLAVHRSVQGRRLGTMLLERAEAYGRAKGCDSAALFVDEGNDRAQRFYMRCGYRTVSYRDEVQCYEMAKPLYPPPLPALLPRQRARRR